MLTLVVSRFLKVTFLVITLIIPLAIFVFLRLFGKNHFDIPIYYEHGVEVKFDGCSNSKDQFHVSDTLVSKDRPTLVMFYRQRQDFDQNILANQLERLHELYGNALPQVVLYTSEALDRDGTVVKQLETDQLESVMHCGFATDTLNQYILTDSQRRIRGYYSTDLEEVDRLVVEIKILLENGTGE